MIGGPGGGSTVVGFKSATAEVLLIEASVDLTPIQVARPTSRRPAAANSLSFAFIARIHGHGEAGLGSRGMHAAIHAARSPDQRLSSRLRKSPSARVVLV